MTVAEAARDWVECKKAEDALRPRKEAAAKVLKAHFRKTERRTYKDLIVYSVQTRRVLDQAALAAEVDLDRFKKPQTVESLSLLK